MLTEICGYLNNLFDVERFTGRVRIEDGVVSCNSKEVSMGEGQLFALLRKNYVLGVYKYGEDELDDKEFDGAVWIMDVPDDVLRIAEEVSAWQAKYGGVDSASMSPFNEESFAGYSYVKSSYSDKSNGAVAWQDMYKSRLSRYRKVSLL